MLGRADSCESKESCFKSQIEVVSCKIKTAQTADLVGVWGNVLAGSEPRAR